MPREPIPFEFPMTGTMHGPPADFPEGWFGVRFTYLNGYGASVIRHAGSYGGSRGFFELETLIDDEPAYIEGFGEPHRPLGWLNADEVSNYLHRIAALPDRRDS